MHTGEQLINPTEARLPLSAQFGAEGIRQDIQAATADGVSCSPFNAAQYAPARDARFSCWGVGRPDSNREDSDEPVNAIGMPEACGQVLGGRIVGSDAGASSLILVGWPAYPR